jgi:arylsulfatase A-like enzyme
MTWPGDDVSPGWRECSIEVREPTRDAWLELTLHGPRNAEALVASPILVSRAAGARPSVFLVLIDTVRFDRLGTFNPGIRVGTFLDRLAMDGIVFEELRSSSSWTRPAVATLWTGLSLAHKTLGRSDVLASDVLTLPEILQENGYETVAWSTNPNVLPIWGFAQGFDAFFDVGAFKWVTDKTDARAVLDLVKSALETHPRAPVFYYIHVIDAHWPYLPDKLHLQAVAADQSLKHTFPAADSSYDRRPEVELEYEQYLAEILDMDEAIGELLERLTLSSTSAPSSWWRPITERSSSTTETCTTERPFTRKCFGFRSSSSSRGTRTAGLESGAPQPLPI